MIAVLSDIHGNYLALKAVIDSLPLVSEIWILGDTLGELPFPFETISCLEQLKEHTTLRMIAGNREYSLLEAHKGEHPDWWKGTRMRALAWTVDQLRDVHWREMEQLSNVLYTDVLSGGAVLCHGTPKQVRGMIRTRKQAEKEIKHCSKTWIICGHTHNSKFFRIDQKNIVNAGSVGISLDGVGGVACYALIEPSKKREESGCVELRYVSYDVEKTVELLKKSEVWELAPGIARTEMLELQTGRHYMIRLVSFCHKYAEQYLEYPVEDIPTELWVEAEKKWITNKFC